MQCPSCGTALSEGAQACPMCGRIFVSAPAPAAAEQASVAQPTPPQPDVAPDAPDALAQPIPTPPSQPLCGPPTQPWYGAPPSMPIRGKAVIHIIWSRAFSSRRYPTLDRDCSASVGRSHHPCWAALAQGMGHRRGGRSYRRRRWRRIDFDCGDSHSAGSPRAMVDARPLGAPDACHGPWECGRADKSTDLSPAAGAESGEQQAVGGGHHAV